jgi:hypothetical protein
MHEAWLTFYPIRFVFPPPLNHILILTLANRRGRTRPRLNLLSCVPCASATSAGSISSDEETRTTTTTTALLSPDSAAPRPPDTRVEHRPAPLKLASLQEVASVNEIGSTEKILVSEDGHSPSSAEGRGGFGRGRTSAPTSPRRLEALANVEFLRAGPWKLALAEGDERDRRVDERIA